MKTDYRAMQRGRVKREIIAMIILIMQISTIDDHDYSGGNSDHDDEGDHSSMGRHVSRCIRSRGGGHHRHTWRTICIVRVLQIVSLEDYPMSSFASLSSPPRSDKKFVTHCQ